MSVVRMFTLGFGQEYPGQKNNNVLAQPFIRIEAPTASDCRVEMNRRFGRAWAFEYSPEEIEVQKKHWPMYEVTKLDEVEAALDRTQI